MASWWTVAGVLDELDLEQNPFMTRVLQAVGMFGDILSLEDTMETVSSAEEEEGSGDADEERDGGSEDERVMGDEERGHRGEAERVMEGDNTGENGEMEERKAEEEDENEGWGVNKEEEGPNGGGKTQMSVNDGRDEEKEKKMQGREEHKNGEEKEMDEEQVETKEQQNKEERKDGELMTPEKENEVNTEGKEDEEDEEKGETTEDEEVPKEERKDERNCECGKHAYEEEELEKKKERDTNEVEKERREMEREELDEEKMDGGETEAAQINSKEEQKNATLDGGEAKLDPSQLKQTPAEGHHGNAHEAGREAVSGDEDEGWDTAQDGDIYPESVDKEPETTTGPVAALRDPTAHGRGLEDTSVTSLPAGWRHSNKEAGQPKADVSSDLQPDSRAEEDVSLVDVSSQTSGSGSKELPSTQNSPATRTWRTQVREVKGNKEKEDQRNKMAATQPACQSSKYKSRSYKKIRKGNTRQKIEKFESRMNL